MKMSLMTSVVTWQTLGTRIIQWQTAVLKRCSTNCPLSDWTCTDATRPQQKLNLGAAVKVSRVSELGVLSGVYAGLTSLFQAAAVDRKLLRDVSQRVRTNQVPGRARAESKAEIEVICFWVTEKAAKTLQIYLINFWLSFSTMRQLGNTQRKPKMIKLTQRHWAPAWCQEMG